MEIYNRQEILLKELERLNREYSFARERAEANSEGAARGDAWSVIFYCGALCRMEEILGRMLTISGLMRELTTPEEVCSND